MEGSSTSTQALEEAHEAFARGEWELARARFEEALEEGPSGAALDGLGQALWWLGDEEGGIETRTQAFEHYRREGDTAAAGNVAIYLASEYRIAGNTSAANGWLGRATRTLEDCGDCIGRGWLEVERSKRSAEPREAERHAREAVQIARRIAHSGLEACALSHLGLARISQDDEEGGLAVLDEAMAIATGTAPDDPLTIGDACCTTLTACERIADPHRARDWGRLISEFVRRRNFTPLAPWCRAVYAGFLITTGQWQQAEEELAGAIADAERVGIGHATSALVNLAGLRSLQGRLEEAGRLLDGIEDRPQALSVALRLDLSRGELDRAAERVERRLEDDPGEGVATATLLAMRAEIALARGDSLAAREATAPMRDAARAASREDVVALADMLDARAAMQAGEQADSAALERAILIFAELPMPLEEGRARLELAGALRPSHETLAIEQARAALGIFERLGAAPDADRAAGLLRELGARGRPAPRGGELSKREGEVLALLGAGLSNAEIAERLVISPRTAEHHVASILRKLELRNRAEAAAYSVREGI